MSSPFPDALLIVHPEGPALKSATSASQEIFQELEGIRERLEELSLEIISIQDLSPQPSSEAIFSSDPISFHEDGTIVRYPLLNEARSEEPDQKLPQRIEEETRFRVRRTIELKDQAKASQALEGEGSIVFDRHARIAYACRSQRTDITLFDHICERSGYRPVSFNAFDAKGEPIGHTSKLLALGNGFALLCEECIEDPLERKMVKMQLQDSGKEVIPIDRRQMNAFAANGLQVRTTKGLFFLLSKGACDTLSGDQLQRIEARTALECFPMEEIEAFGKRGLGSILNGIHLPVKEGEKEEA